MRKQQPQRESSSLTHHLFTSLSQPQYDIPFLLLLTIFEILLCILIITYVPYTEIDWETYNEQVTIFLDGERDYYNIRGSTGPLVYPAGFLYLYGMLQTISGGRVHTAQWVFAVLYVVNLMTVLSVYTLAARRFTEESIITSKKKDDDEEKEKRFAPSKCIWSWRIAMILCCLSKRIHSIFILRLFNDAPAMLLLHLSVLFFATSKYNIGCLFFSLAVSIKMNILLFAPGLLLLLLQYNPNLGMTIWHLFICASVQLVLGAPFLLHSPIHYLRKAFELDRVFFYKWTVNWKLVREDFFVSKSFAAILLSLHILFLGYFAIKVTRAARRQTSQKLFFDRTLSPVYVTYTLFVSNFIGICFARTLHYQFYCWYFYSIPFLLWNVTSFPLWVKIVIVMGIEYAFNVFPATFWSSGILGACHWILLGGVCLEKVPRVLLLERRNKDE